jgi:tRNA threonylcarbamoyladenosine biosynthesis protein TsaB
MAIILNLETASTNCSVALFDGDCLLSVREDRSASYSHSERLHVFIEEELREAGISLEDLQAIAVSKGPGSYTGLRIGVAAAKGLCFALNIPLISLPTLEHMAHHLSDFEGTVIPLLDARRMEVYSLILDNKFGTIRETQAEIITEDSFGTYLKKGKVHLLGPGAAKCAQVINHPNLVIHPDIFPSGLQMGALAFKVFEQKDFEDLAYFEPFYLKDFIAGLQKKPS